MKATVETLESVPEALRTEYEPAKDGGKGFTLKLEGDHPTIAATVAAANAKIGEFRDNNVRLLKEAETAAAKLKTFDGVDPVEYQTLKATAGDLKAKGVKDSADVAKLIEGALAPVLTQLKTFETREADARKALAEKTVEQDLLAAGVKAGIQESALPDFVTRGKKVFERDGEKTVAKQNGTPIFSKKKPGEFLEVNEWAEGLQSDAPHLFKPTVGSGIIPGTGTGAPAPTGTFDGSSDASFLANLKGIAEGKVVRA